MHTIDENPQTKVSQDRKQQFFKQIGLKYDPFATPEAALELAYSSYFFARLGNGKPAQTLSKQPFFEYFYPPPIPLPANTRLLKKLRELQFSFLYGLPGTGKTMLRLALEAQVRWQPNHVLAVTYLPGERQIEKNWTDLAQAFAIDLTLQVIEQFRSYETFPGTPQIEALGRQLIRGGNVLRRLIYRFIEEQMSELPYGYAHLWPAVGRPSIFYVDKSDELISVLKQALAYGDQESDRFEGETLHQILAHGIEAARLWGFENVFLLIDNVDHPGTDEEEKLKQLHHLFDEVITWEEQQIYLKAFLPVSLREALCEYFQHSRLHFPSFDAIINWDEASLGRLISQRFHAVGSRRINFEGLEGLGLDGKLDKLLVRSALGSPRRLLQIISALIDAHVKTRPQEAQFTWEDWETMQREWIYAPPPPLLSISV